MAFEKKKCKNCNSVFEPKNRKQQFCSHKCATLWNRKYSGIEVWKTSARKVE